MIPKPIAMRIGLNLLYLTLSPGQQCQKIGCAAGVWRTGWWGNPHPVNIEIGSRTF